MRLHFFFQMFAHPPLAEQKPTGFVTHGPWDGSGGTTFDDGVYTGIRQITLSRNVGIVYMKVLYEQNGEVVWGSRNGGTGGFKRDKVNITVMQKIHSLFSQPWLRVRFTFFNFGSEWIKYSCAS